VEDEIMLPAMEAASSERKGGRDSRTRGSRSLGDQDETMMCKEKSNETLSKREMEIIREIAMGLSNKEIADKLCLSTHTIMSHRKNIARKLDIHSTAGLTIYAVVNGVVEV
jgi:regulator of cell morphogenesis and NO signaling